MQRYVCSHCDDLECDTSTCPVCGERTVLASSSIYWCDTCNTPSFEKECASCHGKCREIAKDLRPVFPQERLLLEILMHEEPLSLAESSIWCAGGAYYIIDGNRKNLNYRKLMENDSEEVIAKLKEHGPANQKYVDSFSKLPWVKRFIEINRDHLSRIEAEAIDFIQRKSEGIPPHKMFCSFSGGKDSTVTSALVMSALGREDIIHVYGDTTLEYPTSAEYLRRFKVVHPRTPMLVARNDQQDFPTLCKRLGPPSRVMRWCCTVFKTGAITRKIDAIYPKDKSILTFQGIRRAESASRSDYERDGSDSKIAKQNVCQVILDWTNFDVWLYVLSKGIDFNDAYRLGFSRVGCWCCPNNSDWSSYLSSIYIHQQYVDFRQLLYDFARDEIQKSDWKEYVDTGKWKARQGGNDLEYSARTDFSYKPCELEENAISFSLTRPISEKLHELFKPFGILDYSLGNERLGEVFVLDRRTKQPLLKLTGRNGKLEFRVTILSHHGPFRGKNETLIQAFIKAQVTKYQLCLGCGACESVCRHGAISVENQDKFNPCPENVLYIIDSSKCVGCLECVLHFDNGCYLKKVTRQKMEE